MMHGGDGRDRRQGSSFHGSHSRYGESRKPDFGRNRSTHSGTGHRSPEAFQGSTRDSLGRGQGASQEQGRESAQGGQRPSQGIFRIGRDIATRSIAPGFKVYDEKVRRMGRDEYRLWDPMKSKLGAAIAKGLSDVPISQGNSILYLGIASGTTASHMSDIIGKDGVIYGIEFSPRSIRDLMRVSKERPNIVPILADARLTDSYADRVTKVDVLYEDVAQKDQAEILLKNAKLFLKDGGYAMIAIKARSIDVAKSSSLVFEEQKKILERDLVVLKQVNLFPFEKDHCFFVCRKK